MLSSTMIALCGNRPESVDLLCTPLFDVTTSRWPLIARATVHERRPRTDEQSLMNAA